MKITFAFFLLTFFLFVSCQSSNQDSSSQKNVDKNTSAAGDSYEQDLQKLLNVFCLIQKKMIEMKDKSQDTQKDKEAIFEEIVKINEELSKYQEEYNKLMQEMIQTYKGRERDIHNALKETQKNCQ